MDSPRAPGAQRASGGIPVTLLKLDGVSKRYSDGARQVLVLDDVSLQIEAGESVGVMGERRSGKTTLLRVAAGLELADSGTVTFAGAEMRESIDSRARVWRRDGIALVSGDWRPPAGRHVIEEVAMPLLAGGASPAQAERTSWEALDRLDAASLGKLAVDRLSIGERIKVDIARALVREPRLMLIDEPAVLPGPTEARSLRALLRGLPGELGVALVIASEDASAISGLPRVLRISDGHIASAASGEGEVIQFPDGARRRRSGVS